jgi:metallophosphoesterase (TIGR00282 family)
MLGDVTGEAGLGALEKLLDGLKRDYNAHFIVVNGENAAAGFGMTQTEAQRIFAAGADVITSGNHIWEKREFLDYLKTEPRILRPANYPDVYWSGTAPPAKIPGKGVVTLEKDGLVWTVMNLQGREYMTPIDCPFRTFDSIFASLPPFPAVVIVDFHAESGSEKEAFGLYLDGRAAVVAGTHTHIQTADERILPGGTAYITDLGMTGATDGIIGMDRALCLERARTQVLFKLECATAQPAAQGIAVTFDKTTGRPVTIERFARNL